MKKALGMTELQAAELKSLTVDFERWRRAKSRRSERAPIELLQRAAALARQAPEASVLKRLNLCRQSLQRCTGKHGKNVATRRRKETAGTFLEISSQLAAQSSATAMAVSIDGGLGVRITIEAPDGQGDRVAAIVRRIVGGAP